MSDDDSGRSHTVARRLFPATIKGGAIHNNGLGVKGSRKIERLDENNGAVNIQLTAQDLAEIEKAMSNINVVGNRY